MMPHAALLREAHRCPVLCLNGSVPVRRIPYGSRPLCFCVVGPRCCGDDGGGLYAVRVVQRASGSVCVADRSGSECPCFFGYGWAWDDRRPHSAQRFGHGDRRPGGWRAAADGDRAGVHEGDGFHGCGGAGGWRGCAVEGGRGRGAWPGWRGRPAGDRGGHDRGFGASGYGDDCRHSRGWCRCGDRLRA